MELEGPARLTVVDAVDTSHVDLRYRAWKVSLSYRSYA